MNGNCVAATAPANRSWVSGLMVAAAALLVAVVLRYDMLVLGLTPLQENTYPNGTWPYLARSAAFALAALLAFFAIIRLPGRSRLPADSEPVHWARALIWISVVSTVASVALFVVNPFGYHILSLEDHVVEMLSALFALEAALVLAATAVYVLRAQRRRGIAAFICLMALASACFLVGVEEVSWGQRVLDLDTPDAIRALSERNELNFHNMQTAFFEFAYYFGLFLFFIVAPVVHSRTNVFQRLAPVGQFVPTWTSALVAAPAFGYNYVFWNLAFTQVSFWFTFAFLVWHLKNLLRERAVATTVAAGAVLATFLGSQFIFLFHGEMFLAIRLWDATEYKEAILPFALLVYAIVLAHRLRGSGGMDRTAVGSPLSGTDSVTRRADDGREQLRRAA